MIDNEAWIILIVIFAVAIILTLIWCLNGYTFRFSNHLSAQRFTSLTARPMSFEHLRPSDEVHPHPSSPSTPLAPRPPTPVTLQRPPAV